MEFMAHTELIPQLIHFSGDATLTVLQLLISSLAIFLKNNNLKIACIRMELVDENLVIDFIEN